MTSGLVTALDGNKCWTAGNILDRDNDVQQCRSLLSDALKKLVGLWVLEVGAVHQLRRAKQHDPDSRRSASQITPHSCFFLRSKLQ